LLSFRLGWVRVGLGFGFLGDFLHVLGLHVLGVLRILRFFLGHGFFKAFDGAAEIAAERFQSLSAKQQQHYDENNKKLPNADSANAHGYTFYLLFGALMVSSSPVINLLF